MYRDTEFSYREFRCDCYQSPHDGMWCVDFYLPNSTAPMQTVQATRKADAMREAKAKMDERMMTETERLRKELDTLRGRMKLLDECGFTFGVDSTGREYVRRAADAIKYYRERQ